LTNFESLICLKGANNKADNKATSYLVASCFISKPIMKKITELPAAAADSCYIHRSEKEKLITTNDEK